MDGTSTARIGGFFECEIRRPDGSVRDRFTAKNVVPDVGVNYVLNAAFGEVAQISTWYMSVLGNVTPGASTTMATADLEEDNYDEAVRETYTTVASTVKSITNGATPATFTASTGGMTAYGLFLTSVNTKGTTTGTLLAAALFTNSKTLDEGEELVATYTFGGADDGA